MILEDLGLPVLSLRDAGITADVEENGTTFEENAQIKAKTIMEMTGALVLADDSGLEVDALNKEPGIYSARYMGHDTSYHIKNKNIIDRLEGKSEEKRSVCFTRGTMEGQIGYGEKGENGFGYDPIFYLPEYQCYSAELSLEEKNKLSHRGKALRLMKERLHESFNCQ